MESATHSGKFIELPMFDYCNVTKSGPMAAQQT